MHNTLENFHSQKSFSYQTNNVADKLNATMVGIFGYGASLGVFDAFDNIMGGVRNVSITKLRILKRKFIEIQIFGYHHNMKVHTPDDQNHPSFKPPQTEPFLLLLILAINLITESNTS